MEVREIRPEEFDELARVTVEAYRDVVGGPLGDYEGRLADVAGRAAGAVVLVAVEDGRVLGGATYVPSPDSPCAEFDDPDAAGLRMLAVATAARGRGVGRALVLACLERARRDGRARMVLHSAPAMTTAQRLYRRLGFERRPALDFTPDGGSALRAYTYEIARARPGRAGARQGLP